MMCLEIANNYPANPFHPFWPRVACAAIVINPSFCRMFAWTPADAAPRRPRPTSRLPCMCRSYGKPVQSVGTGTGPGAKCLHPPCHLQNTISSEAWNPHTVTVVEMQTFRTTQTLARQATSIRKVPGLSGGHAPPHGLTLSSNEFSFVLGRLRTRHPQLKYLHRP